MERWTFWGACLGFAIEDVAILHFMVDQPWWAIAFVIFLLLVQFLAWFFTDEIAADRKKKIVKIEKDLKAMETAFENERDYRSAMTGRYRLLHDAATSTVTALADSCTTVLRSEGLKGSKVAWPDVIPMEVRARRRVFDQEEAQDHDLVAVLSHLLPFRDCLDQHVQNVVMGRGGLHEVLEKSIKAQDRHRAWMFDAVGHLAKAADTCHEVGFPSDDDKRDNGRLGTLRGTLANFVMLAVLDFGLLEEKWMLLGQLKGPAFHKAVEKNSHALLETKPGRSLYHAVASQNGMAKPLEDETEAVPAEVETA